MNSQEPCSCLERGPAIGRFSTRDCGTDETNGRFGEVSVLTCADCGRFWLKFGSIGTRGPGPLPVDR